MIGVFFPFFFFCNETVHVLHLLLLLLPQIPKEKIAKLKLTSDNRNFTIMYIKEMLLFTGPKNTSASEFFLIIGRTM